MSTGTEVACPICLAEPGQPCIGTGPQQIHQGRKNYARLVLYATTTEREREPSVNLPDWYYWNWIYDREDLSLIAEDPNNDKRGWFVACFSEDPGDEVVQMVLCGRNLKINEQIIQDNLKEISAIVAGIKNELDPEAHNGKAVEALDGLAKVIEEFGKGVETLFDA